MLINALGVNYFGFEIVSNNRNAVLRNRRNLTSVRRILREALAIDRHHLRALKRRRSVARAITRD